MCELVPTPSELYDVGSMTFYERPHPSLPDVLYLPAKTLEQINDQGWVLQCLEPEGWEDLPWPRESERVAVPPETSLRLRELVPLGVREEAKS